MNLLDLMNELGSRARYGMGTADKYKLMASGAVPGQPKPFLPTGEENPEAVRYLSNYLGTQQWGAPASVFNQIRYLIDDDAKAFGAGVKGQQAAQSGPNLQALMTMLASGTAR